jgi:hypothetical protein
VKFDAQCDFAAVVYRPEDEPDRLFIDFAEDLCRAGLHPIGIIQSGRNCRDPRLGVVMLPNRETVGLVPDMEIRADGDCRLDDGRLDELANRLAAAVDGDADVMLINRFGRAEAEGGGLIKVIGQALDADIPVLIAVPERRFSELVRFACGMNVRLPCRREALNRWWSSVARTSVRQRVAAIPTFCELAK